MKIDILLLRHSFLRKRERACSETHAYTRYDLPYAYLFFLVDSFFEAPYLDGGTFLGERIFLMPRFLQQRHHVWVRRRRLPGLDEHFLISAGSGEGQRRRERLLRGGAEHSQ